MDAESAAALALSNSKSLESAKPNEVLKTIDLTLSDCSEKATAALPGHGGGAKAALPGHGCGGAIAAIVGPGSSKTTKKVFKPNLNVVRNKNVMSSKNTITTRGQPMTRGRGGRGRRQRSGANSRLIQTTGLFTEGAGAKRLIRKPATSHIRRKRDDSPSSMVKPVLAQTELSPEDLEIDEMLVNAMLDNSDDDAWMTDAEESESPEQMPVLLSNENSEPEIKLAVPNVQMSGDESVTAVEQKMKDLHVQQETEHSQPTLAEILQDSNTQPSMFVMQFPTTLPWFDDLNSGKTKGHPKPKVDTNTRAATKIQSEYGLNDVKEGQVGKLLRYKSGKTKLVVDGMSFDVNVGVRTGMPQRLMSISTNSKERNGNMIDLGPIQPRNIIVTPDWEHLLQQAKNEKETKKPNSSKQ